MDPADDGDFVKTTDFIDGRVRVGTFDFSDGVDQRVVFYAPERIAVKVTDLFTVETIQKGDKDPLVDRLLDEHMCCLARWCLGGVHTRRRNA